MSRAASAMVAAERTNLIDGVCQKSSGYDRRMPFRFATLARATEAAPDGRCFFVSGGTARFPRSTAQARAYLRAEPKTLLVSDIGHAAASHMPGGGVRL